MKKECTDAEVDEIVSDLIDRHETRIIEAVLDAAIDKHPNWGRRIKNGEAVVFMVNPASELEPKDPTKLIEWFVKNYPDEKRKILCEVIAECFREERAELHIRIATQNRWGMNLTLEAAEAHPSWEVEDRERSMIRKIKGRGPRTPRGLEKWFLRTHPERADALFARIEGEVRRAYGMRRLKVVR
jgi:hypothetical protein